MLSAAAPVRTPRQAAVSGRNQSIHFTTVTLAQMQIDWHTFAISPQKRTMRRTEILHMVLDTHTLHKEEKK